MLCQFLTRILSKVQIFMYLLLLMVLNMFKHMAKVVIKIFKRIIPVQLHKLSKVG